MLRYIYNKYLENWLIVEPPKSHSQKSHVTCRVALKPLESIRRGRKNILNRKLIYKDEEKKVKV